MEGLMMAEAGGAGWRSLHCRTRNLIGGAPRHHETSRSDNDPLPGFAGLLAYEFGINMGKTRYKLGIN